MRAFQVTDHSNNPRVAQVVAPQPQIGQVILQIEACGLNFADLLMAKGTYQDTPALPLTLGMEVWGTGVAPFLIHV